MRLIMIALLAGTPVFADIVASTTLPYSLGGTLTNVDLTGVPLGDATITTSAYTVTFAGSDMGNNGVVTGSDSGHYADPVEDSSGDLWPGNYFSTGTGTDTITITFTTPQTALAFLWGSVDTYNGLMINFDNGGATYTGTQAAAAASIIANGNQGFGGSAWVGINPDTPGGTFTTVTFSSSEYSFEFAGVQASSETYSAPDGGVTLMLLGGALVALETLRRKLRV